MIKLRLGVATVSTDKDTELPDFSFNHAFVSFGENESKIYYLYASDKDSTIKSQAAEIAAHLLGMYK